MQPVSSKIAGKCYRILTRFIYTKYTSILKVWNGIVAVSVFDQFQFCYSRYKLLLCRNLLHSKGKPIISIPVHVEFLSKVLRVCLLILSRLFKEFILSVIIIRLSEIVDRSFGIFEKDMHVIAEIISLVGGDEWIENMFPFLSQPFNMLFQFSLLTAGILFDKIFCFTLLLLIKEVVSFWVSPYLFYCLCDSVPQYPFVLNFVQRSVYPVWCFFLYYRCLSKQQLAIE